MSNGIHWFANSTVPTGAAISPVVFDAASEELTAASVTVDTEAYLTTFDTTSNAIAATVGDGLVHGQLKQLRMRVDGTNDVTVTISSPVSASLDVITFADVGDYVLLIWNEEAGYWRILDQGNDADGTSVPAVA